MNPISEFRGPITSATIFQPSDKACNRCVINKEGDLLFVASANVVYGYNLMTEVCFKRYEGHDGVIEDIDINETSTRLISVGADQRVLIHSIETGNVILEMDSKTLLQCCCFAPGKINQAVIVSSSQMKQVPTLRLFHLKTQTDAAHPFDEKFKHEFSDGVNSVVWPNDNTIIVGDVKGRLMLFSKKDSTEFKLIRTVDAHRGSINSISVSFDKKFISTASADTTACTWTLELEKVGMFPHSFLVSSTSFSPNGKHIVLASSADKKNVATTNFGSTDFTINFFHIVFQEEFASIKVHKSPVNDVKFTPDGMTVVTTSQEGTVMVIRLGEDYQRMVETHDEELEKIKQEINNKK
ncbi:Eukaryotic translation initiation factor 3 subunit I [Histomonas meleagridis]|uniref:Eukaryotic translation initiation factor 3 subunit I n=1 Tax=Histomonas meleagridis TaxID=135588 RepID=UPI003559DC2D|nr:Eukaryotic translation initiation factor 3 subunit I [Histomonas meleagridis]